MKQIPSLFISHGAPSLAIEPVAAHHFLKGLAADLPQPTAVLVVSAHWLTCAPVVSAAVQPETIYDFGGFDEALYQIKYPAPGAPKLAQQVAQLTGATLSDTRGLDHGAWVPLSLIYPQATIPVTQLAVQPMQGPLYHYELGQKLAGLRAQGVLIMASGSLTHNLRAIFSNDGSGAIEPWAQGFMDWMSARLQAGDLDALLDYRAQAPFAVQNHPTDEHLLPLFVALGAGGFPAVRLHHSVEYGALSMDTYSFGA